MCLSENIDLPLVYHLRFMVWVRCRTLRANTHTFHTPSFTFMYSRKGELRGTQNEIFVFWFIARLEKEHVLH